tara:strand:+ start:3533 stop:4552 length:1020 start_codon:yes stop_codon:yes gene_type:complete
MKDLYSILGIQKSSNDSDIKKAYKKLAFQYHPDKNQSKDAEAKFKDISEAYEVLLNPDKRRIYDNFGYDAISGDIPPINPLDLFQSLFNVDFAGLGESMNSNIFVFSDLSSLPFGSLQNKMTYNLELTLEELYHGSQKEFQVQHMTQKGVKSTKYIINVKKGSKNGDNIVVKEGGNYIPELNITEDLVIQVIEKDHSKYKRKGNDLFIEEQITLCEALCGLELTIDHLTGPLQVKISDIVKPNQMFQVFGKGMPIKHEGKSLTDGDGKDDYGDLIIDLQIQFPDSLGDKQKGYLKKILVQLERNKKDGQLVQAYFYKDKEDVVKEMINEEEEGMGCIQQ